MKPHQERVVKEKQELDEKISKLDIFISGSTYAGLPSPEKGRLKNQLRAMALYSYILGERIIYFE